MNARTMWAGLLVPALLALAAPGAGALPRAARQDSLPPTQPEPLRGRLDAERSGQHDANNIRTEFWNYGMVGGFPPKPENVDLTVFHSAEAPRGSGMNYSDGITPFVLARIIQNDSTESYIMETGYRERQGMSPRYNRQMRFEPRPGFFNPDPNVNKARSPAMSHDIRTWPASWPDKEADADDPGWRGSWNGYFGKRPAADQESFTVMDDNFYDAWNFQADSRDATRYGLGLRVEVRGFQWANPQASNVIFWHYDITNESTTFYDNNIIFGLYMDSGVGGSAYSCDGLYESDDDNAFFDKASGLNLVYTWDRFGRGVDLRSSCSPTGYLGYAYMETPGNSEDGLDNDDDGITDESRSSGAGEAITGPPAIRGYVMAHYDLAKFESAYGPLENRPGYKTGVWWTGDEDMDWNIETDDVGVDGVPDSHDLGEGDGVPTLGEPNTDKTDLDESDMIGLTGFKMNRIKCGRDNDNCTTDDVLFFSQLRNWPERLYKMWTDPSFGAHFDSAVAANYNIAFLFASGPFKLRPGQHERFSLALAYGADLLELRNTVKTVKLIYAANYQFATPPPVPVLTAEASDGRVRLSWDDLAEHGTDPVVHLNDFEGYRVYRSTDADFLDPRVITDGRGNGPLPGSNGRPIAQFDLRDGRSGWSNQVLNGVAYWLGSDTGLTHTWTDTTVTNGQEYYYAVTAYDYGPRYIIKRDTTEYFPSENSISISRTALGGLILPTNAVVVRPNRRAAGYQPARAGAPAHVAGRGTGSVDVRVVNSNLVHDRHVMKIRFQTPSSDSVRAVEYSLEDSSAGTTLFTHGNDLDSLGIGTAGGGLLPVIFTRQLTGIDSAATGFRAGGGTNAALAVTPLPGLSPNLRRPGYPEDLTIEFDSVIVDTSFNWDFRFPARPVKFRVIAHGPEGDHEVPFRFKDNDRVADGRLNLASEFIDVITYARGNTPPGAQLTWHIVLDTTGQALRNLAGDTLRVPTKGDVYDLRLALPLGAQDVYRFVTDSLKIGGDRALAEWETRPYVVPNPYLGAASFEPARFAVSGRGERRIEFRAIPAGSTIRIYSVHGDLVKTLHHDGSTDGFVPWDLRTRDNLDVAAGLYIFHVDAPGVGTHVGKFAVVK
ncbi:MAG: hypothetical protein HZB25_11510 [Candidatus Eisenbacteria bacterium]|nr:hypothetical protein [Candidatus Eisenbacteria bacterium]